MLKPLQYCCLIQGLIIKTTIILGWKVTHNDLSHLIADLHAAIRLAAAALLLVSLTPESQPNNL